MPRTVWNIVEAEDNISNKFPLRKSSIPYQASTSKVFSEWAWQFRKDGVGCSGLK